jgi:hypothetical protein
MGGLLLLESSMYQAIAQRRFTHAMVANQDDFARRVMDRAPGGGYP